MIVSDKLKQIRNVVTSSEHETWFIFNSMYLIFRSFQRRKRQTSELSGGDDSNQGDNVKRQCLEDIDERS